MKRNFLLSITDPAIQEEELEEIKKLHKMICERSRRNFISLIKNEARENQTCAEKNHFGLQPH